MNKASALNAFSSMQNCIPLIKAECEKRLFFRDAVILFFLTIVIRLPYFVPTVIHWHESTYTILGQDILNGHLPQTFYSELKPPAAGLPYALFILLFGKSIASIRIGGALCVWLAAVIINFACRFKFGKLSALLASISLILFATTDDRAGCTMLEHIALVPLAIVVLLTCSAEWTTIIFFRMGLVIGLAALLKTNLAFFALAPLLMAIFKWKEFGWKGICKRSLALFTGVALPQLIVLLIYCITCNFKLLVQSSLSASLASASYQRAQFFKRIPEVLQQIKAANPAAFILCWALPFYNVIRILRAPVLTADKRQEREFLIAMVLCIVCGFVTMLVPGVIHARRYYIALLPFTAALAASAFQHFTTQSKRSLSTLILVCAFFVSLMPVPMAYITACMYITGKKTDKDLEVAKYLAARSVEGRYVYFHAVHIGLWLTNAKSPTRFIHPTNMDKSEVLASLYSEPSTAKQELNEIFARKPIYVVTRLRSTVSAESEFTQGLDKKLKQGYRLEKAVGNIGIFRVSSEVGDENSLAHESNLAKVRLRLHRKLAL